MIENEWKEYLSKTYKRELGKCLGRWPVEATLMLTLAIALKMINIKKKYMVPYLSNWKY